MSLFSAIVHYERNHLEKAFEEIKKIRESKINETIKDTVEYYHSLCMIRLNIPDETGEVDKTISRFKSHRINEKDYRMRKLYEKNYLKRRQYEIFYNEITKESNNKSEQ